MITASICLSDIPKEQIATSEKNGKKYLNIVIGERQQPDNYGNTHYIQVGQTKEEREQGKVKVYIGNGKQRVFNNSAQPAQNANNTTDVDAVDDLPF